MPLEALESIRISYFAYYSRDVGFGEHAHDFETVELSLVVEREETTGNCYNVSLFRASGAAHGSDWFSNTLVLRDRRKRQSSDILDVVLPLHVLVEEGKHASAPDRNADGVYSPGYDSTENVVDAWGIRDALRNNMQGGADYQAEHAKVRTRLPLRAVPERYRGAWLAEAAILPREGLESLEPSGGERVPYVLEASGDSAARSWCEAIRASSADGGVSLDKTNARNTSNLRHFMAYWDFCKETEVAGPRPRVWGESGWPGPHGPASGTSRDRLGLTVAMAGGHGHEWSSTVVVSGGIGVIPPVVRGWLVPRIRLHDVVPSTRDACRDPGKPEPSASACGSSRSVAGEIAYMKSGSRLFDWYVAYAPSWSMNRSRDQQEIGIKFRAPWSKTSPLNSMVTAYFGYRGSLLKDVASGRWVVGAGIGGW